MASRARHPVGSGGARVTFGPGRRGAEWAAAAAPALLLLLVLLGGRGEVHAVREAPAGGAAGVGGGGYVDHDIRMPDGTTTRIQYRTGVKRGRELQDGVFAFEIFSKATAKRLIDVIETWSDHAERTLPRSLDFKGIWSAVADSVDGVEELQADLFHTSKVDNSCCPARDSTPEHAVETMSIEELRRHANPNPNIEERNRFDKVGFLLPLMQEIWANALVPHLVQHHGVKRDEQGRVDTPLAWVFLRKYVASTGGKRTRSRIRGHQDDAVFTFNLALSDHHEVEGGELFLCKETPGGYNWLLAIAEGFTENPIQKALTFTGKVLERLGSLNWFDLHHSPARVYANKDGADLCKVAQPEAGHALFHPGTRFHGVLPTKGGIRYSLIFFTTLCGGETACRLQYPDYVEPPSKRVVAGMPRQEALVWLRGVKSAIMGLGKGNTRPEKFQGLQQHIRDQLTGTLSMEEYILALDQYLDDPELCELALFIAFSLTAEEGPFDGKVTIRGYRGQKLVGPNAPNGINGRDHFVAQLKGMSGAEGILGRVGGAYQKKVKQRKKNLSLNKRLAAEACAIARAGGFSLRECSETRPAKYRKPTAAARMSAEEADKRHKDCTGVAERIYREGTGIPARCFELAEANGLFHSPEL